SDFGMRISDLGNHLNLTPPQIRNPHSEIRNSLFNSSMRQSAFPHPARCPTFARSELPIPSSALATWRIRHTLETYLLFLHMSSGSRDVLWQIQPVRISHVHLSDEF